MTIHANSAFYSSKKALLAISDTAALLLASGFSGAAKTEYLLTIKNYDHGITSSQAPTRATAVGQNSTEILYSLGLVGRVVDTSLWLGPVPNACKTGNEKVAVIVQDIPSFEGILARKPGLTASQFEWQIGPAGTVASYEQFSELKVPVRTAPVDCVEDNENGGDGVRRGMFDITMVYQEVVDLVEIFDIQGKGEALTISLKARGAAAKSKITGIDKDVSTMFWFSSANLQLGPYVTGEFGSAARVAQTLGVENVTDSAEERPTVGWEIIAKVNPSAIVLGEMSRRRFLADNWRVEMEYLKPDPVTRLVPVVKENHLSVTDVRIMNAGIRTIDGLERLVNALVEYNLAHPQAAH